MYLDQLRKKYFTKLNAGVTTKMGLPLTIIVRLMVLS